MGERRGGNVAQPKNTFSQRSKSEESGCAQQPLRVYVRTYLVHVFPEVRVRVERRGPQVVVLVLELQQRLRLWRGWSIFLSTHIPKDKEALEQKRAHGQCPQRAKSKGKLYLDRICTWRLHFVPFHEENRVLEPKRGTARTAREQHRRGKTALGRHTWLNFVGSVLMSESCTICLPLSLSTVPMQLHMASCPSATRPNKLYMSASSVRKTAKWHAHWIRLVATSHAIDAHTQQQRECSQLPRLHADILRIYGYTPSVLLSSIMLTIPLFSICTRK